MTETSQLSQRRLSRAPRRGHAQKDGDLPAEHANPNREGQRPAHPLAAASTLQAAPAAPCASAAWRQANGCKPDTMLPSHGGAFSNGDRRRSTGHAGAYAAGRSEFHGR